MELPTCQLVKLQWTMHARVVVLARGAQEVVREGGEVVGDAEPRFLVPWQVEDRPHTAYELEWRAEGRALHFFSYGRRAA